MKSVAAMAILMAATASLLSGAAGQERTPSVSAQQNKEWAERAAKMALAEARSYDVHLKSDDGPLAELVQQPVLKWSNTYDASIYGSALVWMHEGRPQAIACFYKFFTSDVKFDAEFHSLSRVPLIAVKQDHVAWQPAEAGVEFKSLAGAAPPAKTAGSRLVQMRELARGFSAEMVTVVDKTRHRLRLLPQPLVRYGGETDELLDGAIFAFTRETDPDVLLLLEAVPAETGMPHRWEYALARMHVGALSVSLDEKEVWNREEMAWPYERKTEAYSLYQKLPEPAVD